MSVFPSAIPVDRPAAPTVTAIVQDTYGTAAIHIAMPSPAAP